MIYDSQKMITQRDINKIFAHLSPRTVWSWANQGILGSKEDTVNGRGTVRTYSREQVFEAGLIEVLSAAQVSLDNIKTILGIVRNKGGVLENLDHYLVTIRRGLGFKDIKKGVSFWLGNKREFDLLIKGMDPLFKKSLFDYPQVDVLNFGGLKTHVLDLAKKAGVKL